MNPQKKDSTEIPDETAAIVERVTSDPAAITPMSLLHQAVDKGADLLLVEKLMDLRDREEAGHARRAYTEAMAAFRAECPTIGRNKTVSFGNNKTSYTHADLAGTISQIKAILSSCGLSHSWRTEQVDGKIGVTCIVTHVMGHSESTSMAAPSDTSGSKNAIQAIGSTVTYLERYTLFAILGLASTDQDDDADLVDGQSIDDETAVALALRLDAIGGDLKKFLANFGNIERLEDIPQSLYDKADRLLISREKKCAS